MKSRLLRFFFWLCLIESIALMGSVLASNFLNGKGLALPATSLAISALSIVFVVGFGTLVIGSSLKREWLDKLVGGLDSWIVVQDRLPRLSATLIISVIFLSLWLIIYQLPVVHTYSWYSNAFAYPLITVEQNLARLDQAYPLLIWTFILLVQGLILLFAAYPSDISRRGLFKFSRIYPVILINLITYLTLSQWLILASGIQISKLTPVWYWDAFIRPIGIRDMLFLILIFFILALVGVIQKKPQYSGRILAAMVVLGVLLQVGFSFIEGGGFEFIRQKYVNSKHQSYARIASEDDIQVLELIANYEQTYGQKMFPGTKPPGLVLTYVVIQKFVQIFDPQTGGENRFLALTRFLVYLLPLVSFLILPLFYRFARKSMSPAGAYQPGLLYITLPSILLIPLFLDSVLYPVLFLGGVYLMWQVTLRRSIWLAVLSGIYLYLASFVSFSMLPLLLVAALLLGIDFLTQPRSRQIFYSTLKLAGGLAAGVILVFMIFRVALNYDFFTRFQGTRFNRYFDFVERVDKKPEPGVTMENISPSMGEIGRAALTNNLEMAFAAGIPVYLLFITGVIVTTHDLMRRRAKAIDTPLAAMAITYVALNLYGQSQGEVARIWIFWLVMFVLFAGRALEHAFPGNRRVLSYILILQLVSVWILFHFQDLVV